jgi:hypothetical protein
MEPATQFGKWTFLEDLGVIGNSTRWRMRCECGYEAEMPRIRVLGNYSRSCQQCARSKESNLGVVKSWFYGQIYNSSVKRNLLWNVTMEDLNEIAAAQKYKCALTGISLVFADKKNPYNGSSWEHTDSLDRIDSSTGYVYSNIQWVHKDINSMKQQLSMVRFVELCHNISDYQRGNTQ